MNRSRITLGLAAAALLAFAPMLGSCQKADAQPSPDTDSLIAYCDSKLHLSIESLRDSAGMIDYSMMPRNIEGTDTVWHRRQVCPQEWCSGFFPGTLWLGYEATGDTTLLREARQSLLPMEHIASAPVYDHDLGFLMFCSYGNAWRVTGDEHYRQLILQTADSLATLFNPVVGTILSWPRNIEMLGGHNTIMDNMINLEMLFWASKNGGDKSLYDIAVKHAETTMAHHFRDDNTCYHVAVYDAETGNFIKGMTHQGLADNSTWARGQAWAIYGYTMVYRETRDPRFLEFARKVTDVYLDRLPQDMIPFWDFDDPRIPAAPRDASAAAVVASALLELQGFCDSEQSERYLTAAKSMIATLGSDAYLSAPNRASMLDHSTGHHPAGSEIDASIVYADYYFLEALTRLKKLEQEKDILAAL